MTSKESAKNTSQADDFGLTHYPVRLEDKRYELAVIDAMPLALMAQDKDEYYPYNPVEKGFVVKGSVYKLKKLEDKRFILEKVDTSKPLSFRVQFLEKRPV